jgi:hypothetical protein
MYTTLRRATRVQYDELALRTKRLAQLKDVLSILEKQQLLAVSAPLTLIWTIVAAVDASSSSFAQCPRNVVNTGQGAKMQGAFPR